MAVDLYRPRMIPLSDNGVSRLMAEKAIHDQDFRELLLDCVNLPILCGVGQARGKKLQAITESITEFRKQLADKAGLEPPIDSFGRRRDLNTYLKQVTHSRVLVVKVSAQKERGAKVSSEAVKYEWGWVGYPVCVARLASSFLESTLRFQADPSPFPFERLPPELRLQVYREALRGAVRNGVACAEKIEVFRNRRHKFQYQFDGQQKGDSKEINVNLLATNRLVNHEAIPILYQMHTFDFTHHVRSVVPFIRNLSQESWQDLRGISMELHDNREPDHCCGGYDASWGRGTDNQGAWLKACAYIAENLKVKELCLTTNVKVVSAEFKSLKWVKALVKIKGLKRLTLQTNQHLGDEVPIRARYEEGTLAVSRPCFSEHIVRLFEYLREEMLE